MDPPMDRSFGASNSADATSTSAHRDIPSSRRTGDVCGLFHFAHVARSTSTKTTHEMRAVKGNFWKNRQEENWNWTTMIAQPTIIPSSRSSGRKLLRCCKLQVSTLSRVRQVSRTMNAFWFRAELKRWSARENDQGGASADWRLPC